MKKIALILTAVCGMAFTGCNDATSKINNKKDGETADVGMVDNADGEGQPAFKFEKESHDFGTIDEGTLAEYDFKFTNTGDAPLIITNAAGSCGCTVPKWPNEPIAPGEEGVIHVEFDSQGRTGLQQKQVTINANTVPNTKLLRISSQVTPKAKDGETAEG